MIDRFDHAVIAVRDLETAIDRYRSLGFAVGPGGRHPGRGTANAIIRFGLDYLELITVTDPAEAVAAGGNSLQVVRANAARESTLLGYALATGRIQALAARLRGAGMELAGPIPRHRIRPDGSRLDWSLLIPGGASWGTPWPFFIEWSTNHRRRLAIEPPGCHPNRIEAVAGIRLMVADLRPARHFYQTLMGLVPVSTGEVPHLAAARTSYLAGGLPIEILTPLGAGPLASALAERGDGLFEVALRPARGPAGTGAEAAATEADGRTVLAAELTLGVRLTILPE